MDKYAALRATLEMNRNLKMSQAFCPDTIRALLAERDALWQALEVAIAQMEYDAAKIDGEWGDCRSIDELERDGGLPEALARALARALAALQSQDRLDAERYRWLCDKFGITKLPCALERIIAGDAYVSDGKAGIDAAIDHARRAEGADDA